MVYEWLRTMQSRDGDLNVPSLMRICSENEARGALPYIKRRSMQDRSAVDKETKLTGTYYYRADIPEACKRPHGHELL